MALQSDFLETHTRLNRFKKQIARACGRAHKALSSSVVEMVKIPESAQDYDQNTGKTKQAGIAI